jgi:hypothetical protein
MGTARDLAPTVTFLNQYCTAYRNLSRSQIQGAGRLTVERVP